MNVELHAKSDVGRVRRGNEDNFLVLELSKQQIWTGTDGSAALKELASFELGQKGLVLVVSDGMGGALAGDVASRMAVDSVRDMILAWVVTLPASALLACITYLILTRVL